MFSTSYPKHVSLDALADNGFEPSYLMEWDEAPADEIDPFSDDQHRVAQALLAAGITAEHVRTGWLDRTLADLVGSAAPITKEITMATTSNDVTLLTLAISDAGVPDLDLAGSLARTAYDSGAVDSENRTLAEQIEAVGIEVVASAIVAQHASSVADDKVRDRIFDPTEHGFIPVLDLFTDDEVNDVLVPLCQKTRNGEPNPLYVTQVWLDGEIGVERLYVSRFPSTDPEDRLGQPVVIYTQQYEDDESGFVQNLPVAFLKVLTVKAGRDFASQFRPAPSPEEIERTTASTMSAADKIRRLANITF